MNIFICASKHLYQHIPEIKQYLEEKGHVITLPNSFDNPTKELQMKELGAEEHRIWKASMLRLQKDKVAANDAILVINEEKNGQPNYIGGATFLEIYMAFELDKKIFLYNPLTESIFRDELLAMNPIIINKNLDLVV